MGWWVALFDKLAASDFMCESAEQKANWLTIDWILNEQNMVKVLEGKYDNDRRVTANVRRYKPNNLQERVGKEAWTHICHELRPSEIQMTDEEIAALEAEMLGGD